MAGPSAEQLVREGKLDEALAALSQQIRANPAVQAAYLGGDDAAT